MTGDRQVWGPERLSDGRWRIATWAPSRDRLDLFVDGDRHPMSRSKDGWHTATVSAEPGARYGFEIEGRLVPDPASRQQSGDVHAASVLVDPLKMKPARAWSGRDWESAVVFELHVGTFTQEGTLRAAAERLAGLAALGITAVELMPLGQFAGERGWGYDVVLPFALHPAYGTPADMTAFVDAAHDAGLMVLVDAVYNHFGPEGAVLHDLCPDFFDADRHTPWGAGIDFSRGPVRDYVLQNARMWMEDYGVDGLRLDAVHQLGNEQDLTMLRALAYSTSSLDLGRPLHLVTEDERNLASYVAPDGAIRAQWNDDYHHAIHCLLTGEAQSYYAPFAVDPFGDLVTALRDGQVDQGQMRQGAELRGEPSGHLPPQCFVNANQTHDQIGNRALGERLISLADAETMRAMHALLLLAPFVPMLFMGQEAGSRAPFQFFTDFEGDLAEAVRNGRRSEFPEFGSEAREIPDPNARSTFEASRPYGDLPDDAEGWRDLTRHCLALRHEHIVPLLKSGWLGTEVHREGGSSLIGTWRFKDGTLGIAFAFDASPLKLQDNMTVILDMTAAERASLTVGVGEAL